MRLINGLTIILLATVVASCSKDSQLFTAPRFDRAGESKLGAQPPNSEFSVRLLPLAAEVTGGEALGLSDNGQIVGYGTYYPARPNQSIVALWSSYRAPRMVGISGLIAYDINNRGDIVGLAISSVNPQISDAILIDQSGFRYRIDVPGATNVYPLAVNERGDVVGWASVPVSRDGVNAAPPRAFFWSKERGGFIIPMPFDTITNGILDANSYSQALDINNSGRVVLVASSRAPFSNGLQSYVWSKAEGLRKVPHIGHVPDSIAPVQMATGINNHGEVVGSEFSLDGQTRGFVVSREGRILPLDHIVSVDGTELTNVRTALTQINDSGDAIGVAFDNVSVFTGVFRSREGRAQELPGIGGWVQPNKINNSGLIVGDVFLAGGYLSQPAVWLRRD